MSNDKRLTAEEFIKELRINHGITMPPDDPLLAFMTMNDLFLSDYEARLEEVTDNLVKRLTASLVANKDASKRQSERIITDAAGYVTKEVQAAVIESVSQIKLMMKEPVEEALRANKNAIRVENNAKTYKNIAIIASVIAAAAAAVSLACVVLSVVR